MAQPFHEIRLNPLISYDSQIGPSYDTSITVSKSQDEQRRQWLSRGRYTFRIKKELLTRADQLELEGFFRARKGRAYGFRLRHWNYHIATDQTVGIIDATHGQFQYTYPDALNAETINIYKPVLAANVDGNSAHFLYAPDITLKRDGIAWASGGNWTLDRNTGIVTYSVSQTGHTILWSGDFDFPVRFNNDQALFHREALDIHDWSDIEMMELIFL